MPEFYPSKHRGKTHVEVLPEETYEEQMMNTVEPLLQRCRTAGNLTIVRGMRLSYEYYLCADPVGAIVICHGFSESAEKFREMAYYFLEAGYSVFLYDQRGHGRSHRDVENTEITHVEKFQDYVNDLDLFLQRIVRPNAVNLPLYLFGHSMGGAVAALHLSQHPIAFRKALLNAPMIAAKTLNTPPWAAKLFVNLLCLARQGKEKLFFYRGFNENEDFAQSADTSFARFEYYRQKRLYYRHLRNTAPTYQWLKNALGVTKILLKKDNCAAVQAPVLLLQAENDVFVHDEPQELYIRRIPHGELERIPGSKHEIYLSENRVLQPYLDRILAFFAK